MSRTRDEDLIRELLRTFESDSRDDAASKSRVLNRTLDAFDEALNQAGVRPAVGHLNSSTTAQEPVVLVELSDEGPRRDRHRKTGRILVLASTLAILVIFGFLRAGGENIQTTGDDDGPAGVLRVGEVDASEVVPGLILEIDGDNVSVKRVESGLMVLELRGDLSPVSGSTELTLISVETWGPALVPDSVPRVERPDSLNSWLAISGEDLSTFVPFTVTDPMVEVESWRVRLGAGNDTCVGAQPCGYVAQAEDGSAISVIAGLTNELTSVNMPNMPTVLVHVAYSGDSRLTEPAGAEILRSMRIRQG